MWVGMPDSMASRAGLEGRTGSSTFSSVNSGGCSRSCKCSIVVCAAHGIAVLPKMAAGKSPSPPPRPPMRGRFGGGGVYPLLFPKKRGGSSGPS